MNRRSTSVPEKLAFRGFVLVAALLIWAPPTRAEALIADLTSHLIAITTGFTGASVVLFGATDGPGDVVVTVRGPDREMTVRRKSHQSWWTRFALRSNIPNSRRDCSPIGSARSISSASGCFAQRLRFRRT